MSWAIICLKFINDLAVSKKINTDFILPHSYLLDKQRASL